VIPADVTNIELASLCVRYVLDDQIYENFLMFISVKDRSGADLADIIITSISDLGKSLSILIK
jgi:hypothetical protein